VAAHFPNVDGLDSAPSNAMIRVPVDVRSVTLAVLTVLAVIFTLRWARAVFVPVLLGLMLSYALTPIVNRLQRWHIPRALGQGCPSSPGARAGCSIPRDDAAVLIEALPEAAQKLRRTLQDPRPSQPGTIDNVQKAATELQRAAEENAATPAPAPPGVTRVVIEKPRFNVRDYLWTGTLGAVSILGQTAVVILLTFFMLVSGDSFRRKLVKLAGPGRSQKRITVEALHEIDTLIQSYLLIQVITSMILGTVMWIAFAWIGLQQAAVWGVAAGVTNLIPYLGGLILGVASMLVAYMQFGTIEMALLVGVACFAIHGVVGNLLTPWMTGRAARMSPVTVFIGVIAWGWLWGIWGLLLGVPVLLAVKTVCDRVEDLKPVGEFLGA
jgi:predicted PurR-regulated permease PerM